MVELLGPSLSVGLSLLMLWAHVLLLAVGSLGMARLPTGIICVLSLLMYLNCYQHHKSMKLNTRLNDCQVVTQVNDIIECYHQSYPKYIDNLMSI